MTLRQHILALQFISSIRKKDTSRNLENNLRKIIFFFRKLFLLRDSGNRELHITFFTSWRAYGQQIEENMHPHSTRNTILIFSVHDRTYCILKIWIRIFNLNLFRENRLITWNFIKTQTTKVNREKGTTDYLASTNKRIFPSDKISRWNFLEFSLLFRISTRKQETGSWITEK